MLDLHNNDGYTSLMYTVHYLNDVNLLIKHCILSINVIGYTNYKYQSAFDIYNLVGSTQSDNYRHTIFKGKIFSNNIKSTHVF